MPLSILHCLRALYIAFGAFYINDDDKFTFRNHKNNNDNKYVSLQEINNNNTLQITSYFCDNLKIKYDEIIKFEYDKKAMNNNLDNNDIFKMLNSKYNLKCIDNNSDDNDQKYDDDDDDDDDNEDKFYQLDDINNFIITEFENWSIDCSGMELSGDLCKQLQCKYYNKIQLKTFHHQKYEINNVNNNIPLNINCKLNISKYYDNLNGNSGIIQITSKKSIIINKNGQINANYCDPKVIFHDDKLNKKRNTMLNLMNVLILIMIFVLVV